MLFKKPEPEIKDSGFLLTESFVFLFSLSQWAFYRKQRRIYYL